MQAQFHAFPQGMGWAEPRNKWTIWAHEACLHTTERHVQLLQQTLALPNYCRLYVLEFMQVQDYSCRYLSLTWTICGILRLWKSALHLLSADHCQSTKHVTCKHLSQINNFFSECIQHCVRVRGSQNDRPACKSNPKLTQSQHQNWKSASQPLNRSRSEKSDQTAAGLVKPVTGIHSKSAVKQAKWSSAI